jgi:hypothetical protein
MTFEVTQITSDKIFLDLNVQIESLEGENITKEGNGQYILDRNTCKLISSKLEMQIQGGKVSTNSFTK